MQYISKAAQIERIKTFFQDTVINRNAGCAADVLAHDVRLQMLMVRKSLSNSLAKQTPYHILCRCSSCTIISKKHLADQYLANLGLCTESYQIKDFNHSNANYDRNPLFQNYIYTYLWNDLRYYMLILLNTEMPDISYYFIPICSKYFQSV